MLELKQVQIWDPIHAAMSCVARYADLGAESGGGSLPKLKKNQFRTLLYAANEA